MSRTTKWRDARREALGISKSARGSKRDSDPLHDEWRGYAGAIIAMLRQHGRAVDMFLRENAPGRDELRFIRPSPEIERRLANSGISAGLLAYCAADFAKVSRREQAGPDTIARRESSSAVFWKSIPGFNKRLAWHCAHKAKRREEAFDLIRELAGLTNAPRFDRKNETKIHLVKIPKPGVRPKLPPVMKPETRSLFTPARAARIEHALDQFIQRSHLVTPRELTHQLDVLIPKLVARHLRIATRLGEMPVESNTAASYNPAPGLPVPEREQTLYEFETDFVDDIDRLLGWSEPMKDSPDSLPDEPESLIPDSFYERIEPWLGKTEPRSASTPGAVTGPIRGPIPTKEAAARDRSLRRVADSLGGLITEFIDGQSAAGSERDFFLRQLLREQLGEDVFEDLERMRPRPQN